MPLQASISGSTSRQSGDTGAAVLLAIACNYLFMTMLSSAYSTPAAVSTVEAFRAQYFQGIYAYRILARDLILFLAESVFSGDLGAARLWLNGAAAAGTSVVFLRLCRRHEVERRFALVSLIALQLLIGLSTYARSNPYTIPVVFLICLGALMAECRSKLGVVLCTIAGTLTHEIALLIPLYWLARETSLGFEGETWRQLGTPASRASFRRALAGGVVVVAAFLVPYVVIRLAIETSAPAFGAFESVTVAANLRSEGAAFVLCFVVAALYLLLSGAAWGRMTPRRVFHLVVVLGALAPYGTYMFFIATMAEFRLFLPFLPFALLLSGVAQAQESSSSASESRQG